MRVVTLFVALIAVLVAASVASVRFVSGQTDVGTPIPLQNPAIPPDRVGGQGPLLTSLEMAESSSVSEGAGPVVASSLRSTSVDQPSERFLSEKQFMLGLINAERKKAGVPEVSLGDNIAAQIHAENSIRDCVSAHWGTDGLGPPMRYSLAGGYQSNGENASGPRYCLTDEERPSYASIHAQGGIQNQLRQDMRGYMNSPGHKRNILNPWHRKVNLGVAWDTHQMWTVQHFEGDYADCSVTPVIEGTTLRVSCTAMEVFPSDVYAQQIYYDPPYHALRRGQLARSYSYRSGNKVGLLRGQSRAGYVWASDEEEVTHYSGCTPYDFDPTLPPPSSFDEVTTLFNEAKLCELTETTVTVPWITGEETIDGRSFKLAHDIGLVLRKHGAGVYTVVVWGCSVADSLDNPCEDENAMPIVERSIFYGIDPPDTYTPAESSSSTPTATPAAGSTTAAPRVGCGSAVADTSNAALVADCEYLLGMKSELQGSGKLNWWSGRGLDRWDGIKVEDGRVIELLLPNHNLDGMLPVGVGNLGALKTLDLSSNSLTGTIPASLNNLTALTKWRLAGNSLSGCVPYNFAQVSDNDAASLNLPACGGSGAPVPTATPMPTATPTPGADDVTTLLAEGHCTQEDLTQGLGGTYTRTDFIPLVKYDVNGWGLYAFAQSRWVKDDDSDKYFYCLSMLYENVSSAVLDVSYDRMRRLVEGNLDVLGQSKGWQLPEIGHRFMALHVQLGDADVDGDRRIRENELDAVAIGGETIALLRRGALVVVVSESSYGPEYADRRPPAVDGVVAISRRIDARLVDALAERAHEGASIEIGVKHGR